MHGIGQKEPTEGNQLSSVDQVCRCRSIKMIRPRPITSDQIKPNPTKKNGPARIKARAVGSKLARTKRDLGRARWLRGNAERTNAKANCLRAGFKISRGPVFGQKAGGRDEGGAARGHHRATPKAFASRAKPDGFLPENPPGGGSFARGRRWLVAYSPLRGA